MKNQKVYRRRGPRRNMALPLILALVLVAGVAIALVSCNAQPAPEEPAAPSGSQQEAPESSSAQEEPEVPQQSQSEEAPEEKPVEESSQSQQQTNEAPVTELESDGEEIAIPASLAGADHLFPAGNGDYRLILVNKEYTMPNEISDLPLKNIGDGYRVQADMYDALVKMMDDAKAAGLPLYIVSGYRPIERSRVLYENKVQEYLNAGYSAEEAAVQAGMWIAPPGTSEHTTGLAVDLISADYYTKLPDLLPEFEEFEEAKWMKEHCAEYGFILRFPKGKEDIT